MNGKSKLQYQRVNRTNHVGFDRIGRLHFLCLHKEQTENKCCLRNGSLTDQSMPDLRGLGTFESLQLERMAKSFTAYGGICRPVSDRLAG